MNDIMKITLNGKEVQVPSNAILGGSISNLEASSNRWTWTNWFDVDLGEQQLINGENTVTVTFLDAGYRDTYGNPACGQLDCMNVFLGGGAA